jgi:hypothetical protein
VPEFLKRELEKEYPNNPHAIYGTMNKIGAMRGSKETKLGRQMEQKHREKLSHQRSKSMSKS